MMTTIKARDAVASVTKTEKFGSGEVKSFDMYEAQMAINVAVGKNKQANAKELAKVEQEYGALSIKLSALKEVIRMAESKNYAKRSAIQTFVKGLCTKLKMKKTYINDVGQVIHNNIKKDIKSGKITVEEVNALLQEYSKLANAGIKKAQEGFDWTQEEQSAAQEHNILAQKMNMLSKQKQALLGF